MEMFLHCRNYFLFVISTRSEYPYRMYTTVYVEPIAKLHPQYELLLPLRQGNDLGSYHTMSKLGKSVRIS